VAGLYSIEDHVDLVGIISIGVQQLLDCYFNRLTTPLAEQVKPGETDISLPFRLYRADTLDIRHWCAQLCPLPVLSIPSGSLSNRGSRQRSLIARRALWSQVTFDPLRSGN
jgi:hypothetical protein